MGRTQDFNAKDTRPGKKMDDEDGENDSTFTRSPMGLWHYVFSSHLLVLHAFFHMPALACAFCTEIEPFCSSSQDEDFSLFSQLPSRVTSISESSSSDEEEAFVDVCAETSGQVTLDESNEEFRHKMTIQAQNVTAFAKGCSRGRVTKALIDSSDEEDCVETGCGFDTCKTAATNAERSERGPRRRIRAVESSSDEEHSSKHEGESNVHTLFQPDVDQQSMLSPDSLGRDCKGTTVADAADRMQRLGICQKRAAAADNTGIQDECEHARSDTQRRASSTTSDGVNPAGQRVRNAAEGIIQEGDADALAARHKTPKKTRVAFNQFVREAQAHEKEGRLGHAVASYKEAMLLYDADGKLAKKIQKLEALRLRGARRQSQSQEEEVTASEDEEVERRSTVTAAEAEECGGVSAEGQHQDVGGEEEGNLAKRSKKLERQEEEEEERRSTVSAAEVEGSVGVSASAEVPEEEGEEEEDLVKTQQKLETLRAIRRQSKRQSMALAKLEEDGGMCAPQTGWYFDSARAAYALCDTPPTDFAMQASLYTRLLPYQRDGVRWLWELHCAATGGILGDEMGLGKTCQTVVFLSAAMASGQVSRVLVVAPVSVLSVWRNEFDKFCPDLSIQEASGSGGSGVRLRRVRPLLFHGTSLQERARNLAAVARDGGVLITSYTLASAVKSVGMLGKVKWDYVVCDEGHKLKNPNIQTSKGLRMIGTSHRLLLTGTPLQNNLEELRALYDFAAPGLLPAQDEFKRYYARPITDGADRDASEAEQLLGELRARELRDKIRP